MTIYVIVEKDSHLIQENEDGMLCFFTEREQAESFLRLANNPVGNLDKKGYLKGMVNRKYVKLHRTVEEASNAYQSFKQPHLPRIV